MRCLLGGRIETMQPHMKSLSVSSLQCVDVVLYASRDQHSTPVDQDSPLIIRMRLMMSSLNAARRDLRVALPYAERALPRCTQSSL